MTSKSLEKEQLDTLKEISKKLDQMLLLFAIQGREKEDQLKILKNYQDQFSKREIQRLTGIDRRDL